MGLRISNLNRKKLMHLLFNMDRIQLLIYFTFLSYVTSDTCTSVGMVRVQNLDFTGTKQSYLQVCLNHTNGSKNWSFICSQDMNGTIWSVDNRHVWCRSRSLLYEFSELRPIQNTSGTYGQGELKITNVNCNRTINEGIINCHYNTTLDECNYLHRLECSLCFTDENNCNLPGICVNGSCRCTSSCENRGFCDQGRCQCRYPFEGESCQNRACVAFCPNNAKCDNSTGTCKCIQPYSGPNCDLVQCPSECNNNQECNLTGMCECKSSYFGPNCQLQNCSMPCPVNQTCDTTNGICRMDSTDCIDCSNCTDNCNNNDIRSNDIPLHYIWISVGVTFFLILCILIAGLICCVVMLTKCFTTRKRSQLQKNALYVENGSSTENVTATNTIEMEQTGLNSKHKLKENVSYFRHNTRDVCPSTPEQQVSPNRKYSMLSSEHLYSQPEQEISASYGRIDPDNVYDEAYTVFLDGEKPEEQLYVIYSKINESALPSRHATIVLTQEERNSVNLQEEDNIIYETYIKQAGRKDTSTKFFSQTFEYSEPPHDLPKIFDRMSSMRFREINPDTLTKQNYLGSGEFGTVYKGLWKTGEDTVDVAIKELNQSSKDDVKTAFMKEAAIMGQFSHPNVLRLLGILSLSDPFMIVTELMKAELLDVLLSFKTSGIDLNKIQLVLLKFCQEIGCGMEYLASRECVHRDLAARNVLLTKNMVCKISDFGMSREFKQNYNYYKSSGGLIPVKWTSPEAIFYQRYTEKSDVWAFGMTMFEIWSLGYKPWHNKSNQEIVNMMQAREVIAPPTGCPQDIYEIMLKTWKYDVDERCTFTEICQLLKRDFVFTLNKSSYPQYVLGNDPSLVKNFH